MRRHFAELLDVLRAHCNAEGRDYDRIEKTVLFVRPVLDDVEGFVSDAAAYGRLGLTEMLTMPHQQHPVEYAEQLGERVIPRLGDIA